MQTINEIADGLEELWYSPKCRERAFHVLATHVQTLLTEAERKGRIKDKLLLDARNFVLDARGSWDTSQGERLIKEIDELELQSQKED